MLSQSTFVVQIILGETTGWGAQLRDEHHLQTRTIVRTFGAHTVVGISATAAILYWAPGTVLWFAPLLIGPILAIPLTRFTSSVMAGQVARRLGLFAIPAECGKVPIVARLQVLMESQSEH
jgi:membrane glycosyltransferase